MSPKLIAEVKTHSPFRDMPKENRDWMTQFAIAEQHGDIISIHTDPRWHGSMDLINVARSMTDKPILAKGMHDDDQYERALEAGANFVLCVGDYMAGEQTFYEYLHYMELAGDWNHDVPLGAIVVNSRDPFTGCDRDWINAGEIERIRRYSTAPIVQASNIRTTADVWPGVDYVLVGTNLREYVLSMKEGNHGDLQGP